MRCLALSEELTRKNHKCTFIINKIDGIVKEKIEQFKIDFYELTAGRKEEDELINFAKNNEIEWIITDSYKVTSDCIQKFKKENFRVLSIDDNSQIHYFSDVVVNQNIFAKKLEYSIEPYTELLLGPKYAIIRNELLKRKLKPKNQEVKKILITIGGTDNDNFTLKILKMLELINDDIDFIIVLGPFNPYYEDIKNYTGEQKRKIDLIKSPKQMLNIYLQSDIAISGGGVTCYELAYFGIPNIIITIVDNHLLNAQELNKQNIGIHIGRKNEIKMKHIRNKIEELIKDKKLREKMCQNGKKLVDGKGKKRIVECMEKYN